MKRPVIRVSREPDKFLCIDNIRHVETEYVSFWEGEVDYKLVEAVLGREVRTARSYLMPAEDYVEFTRLTGQDLIKLHVPWQPDRKIFYERGIANYAGGTVRDYEDIKAIKPPEMDPIRRRIEDILDEIGNGRMGINYAPYCTPNIVTDAIGYEEYYMCVAERPKFIDDHNM